MTHDQAPSPHWHVLVTGGAGYIGSHTTLALLEAGHRVTVFDNFSNSHPKAVARIEQLSGQRVPLVQGDVRDAAQLAAVLAAQPVDAVIHFAGLKAVGESVQQPLAYYAHNVAGSLQLLNAMEHAGVRRLVFSSSATVYGPLAPVPYRETMPLGQASNPYGRSKIMVEQALQDLAASDARWQIAALRYFNPIGAHPSGLMGDDPQGIPNNLLPFVTRVALGQLPELAIFGGDYDTPDGTCLRDYLHVMDLAQGHVAALQALSTLGPLTPSPAEPHAAAPATPPEAPAASGFRVWNLGTGQGVSVLDIVRGFEALSGQHVPYRIAPRRDGDLPAFWADASRAQAELGWRARHTLAEMLQDAWRWQCMNPQGYRSDPA